MKKEYSNGEITITWEPSLCMHSGNCVRLLPNVYHPKLVPWIKPNNADTQQLINQIKQCPSGALGYRLDDKKK